jgi:hypothetical protein
MELAKPELSVWGRLGYVLNWAGIVAGLALGAFIAFAMNSLGVGWQIVFGGAAFLFCYTIGRALRFILTGR